MEVLELFLQKLVICRGSNKTLGCECLKVLKAENGRKAIKEGTKEQGLTNPQIATIHESIVGEPADENRHMSAHEDKR